MSIDNTSGDTLNNEVLTDEAKASLEKVSTLEKELAEAKALADTKANEARKANYKVELENKYSKTLDTVREEFSTKISEVNDVLKKVAEENESLKTILQNKSDYTPNISTQPINSTAPNPDALNESKVDLIRKQMGIKK